MALEAITVPTGSRAETIRRWRRRSSLIHFWRRALPTLIVAILVGMIGWVGAKTLLFRSLATPRISGSIHMLNPKFYGRDGSGRAYTLSAKDAVRDDNDAQLVALTEPVLTLNSEKEGDVLVTAGSGVYREDDKILRLTGGVIYRDTDGYHFNTPTAMVDTQADKVSGNDGVQGEGPMGVITARSYVITEHGNHIAFSGGVHGRMNRD